MSYKNGHYANYILEHFTIKQWRPGRSYKRFQKKKYYLLNLFFTYMYQYTRLHLVLVIQDLFVLTGFGHDASLINLVKIKFRPHSLFVILNHAHPNNLIPMMVINSVVLTPGLIKTLEIKD